MFLLKSVTVILPLYILMFSNCGKSQDTDPRLDVPWLASVFERMENGSIRFLRNGVIISKSSVMILGDLQKFSKISMENIIIGVSFKKTSLDSLESFDIDGYSQVLNAYFNQYPANSTNSDRFNYAIIHLTSRFQINKYAQIGEIGFLIEDSSVKVGEPVKNRIILGGDPAFTKQYATEEYSRIAGYSRKSNDLTVFTAYKYEVAIEKNISLTVPEKDNECIKYSNIMFHYSTSYENTKERWLVSAYVKAKPNYKNSAIIPPVDFDSDFCINDLYNTTFVVIGAESRSQKLFQGGKRCKRKFSCHDSLLCLELSKVCNGVKDCKNGQDEEEIYCNISFPILSKEETKYDQLEDDSGNLDTYSLIFIISGTILGILFIGLMAFWMNLRNKEKMLRVLTSKEIEEFKKGKPIPTNNEETTVHFYENIAYNESYEILSSQLKTSNQILGEGEYGIVCKGELTINHAKCEVAVKTVKPNVDIQYVRAILSEIKIMQYIGQHPNIVGYFGSNTKSLKNGSIQVVVEFCKNGSLKDYLYKYRSFYEKQLESDEQTSYPIFFNWALQISNGMAHLSEKNIIHSDLAARNILLTHDCIAKISDFGLSRQLFNYSNYIKTNQAPLPWRWMPIESLNDMCFSTKSDVWGFGVTLWEIFSLAQIPFPGLTWETNFVDKLKEGLRLQNPKYLPPCFRNVYDKMLECWDNDPESRPSFKELQTFFQSILDQMTNKEINFKSKTFEMPIQPKCENLYTNTNF